MLETRVNVYTYDAFHLEVIQPDDSMKRCFENWTRMFFLRNIVLIVSFHRENYLGKPDDCELLQIQIELPLRPYL